jgi:IclR family KDG regulon transcriptional repressor
MGQRSSVANEAESASAARAVQIIEYLSLNREGSSIRDMARTLRCSASTLHRYLATFKTLGYLRQNPSGGHYELTPKLAWLASQVMDNLEITQVARPLMEALSKWTQQTTHLAVLDDTEMVYVAKVEGNDAVNMRSRIGSRANLHSTAAGKAILAFLPPDARKALMRKLKLPALTAHTITSKQQLSIALDHTIQTGYAIDDEENEIGIRCIGAPVFDLTGHVAGALSISGWTVTMTSERARELAPDLTGISGEVSRALGWYPVVQQQKPGRHPG